MGFLTVKAIQITRVFLTPKVISPRSISRIWTHWTQLRFFFPVSLLEIKVVSHFYLYCLQVMFQHLHTMPNVHPYEDTFCREVFPWCNFRDEQMAIGLWRCYWIVTAGNKVPAEHSTVWLPYPKLSYQHWQLWVHIFADKVITLDSKALEHCVFGMICYSLYSH